METQEKSDYELFINRKASDSAIKFSLKNLSLWLYKCYGVKPIILIDEYDTPIQTAYIEQYYDNMIRFMREFLSAGLKDNRYFEKTILTGILRVAKESLFSGLNNLKVYSLLEPSYSEYFGFTEAEVNVLLAKINFNGNIENIKAWYNGYQVGNTIIYNPWSIINYLETPGKLRSYWVNTSDNALIKQLLIKSSVTIKEQFECLLRDKSIDTLINEHIIFNNLETNESAIWTLFLMSLAVSHRIDDIS